MKKMLFTRIVCIILCICMLLPTFLSCSSDDPEADNPDRDGTTQGDGTPDGGTPDGGSPDGTPGGDTPSGDTPSGDTPSGDTPSGDTETTYYKVTFAVALEEYKSRVTLPAEKLYAEGTEIQYLPTPGVRELLFMGWYYDAAMTREVALTDKVTSDLMLYAKVVDTSEDILAIEGVYYHTVYDVGEDYLFSVAAGSAEDVKTNLSILNISSAGAPLVPDEDYTIRDNGDGSFLVDVNYKAGKTYRVTLTSGLGLYYIVDGSVLHEQVTTLNVLVAKEEVSNLTLADGLIYLPREDVALLSDTPNGLVTIGEGNATVNSGSEGYFSYDGATLRSGDRVAIYEGDIPSERDFGTDNGAVKYLTVIGVEQNNVYKYRVSDSEEILFIPDIIPVSGRTNVEGEAKILVTTLDFSSDLYRQLGMDEDTKVEAGDYIAFFDGPMSEGTPVEYVKITSVWRDNTYYYVDYTVVSYDEVIASMDVYHTKTNTPELSEDQISLIKESVYQDAMESGFVDEAAAYLVDLYLTTDGLKTLPKGVTLKEGSSNGELLLSSSAITNREGISLTDAGGVYYEVTKCEAKPDIKIGKGVLKHFEESDGIRVELVLSFEVEFTIGEDGENKLVIAAEAVFEEEILLTTNVDGGAIWEFAWIFPYIVDYEINANIDIGTYTGVSVIAKVYTSNGEEKEEEEEDDDDSFFPDFDLDNIGKGDSYAEKAKNIGEELKKLFELNDKIQEEVKGEEEEDDTGNDITEKYAEMMKDANEAWIEIVRTEIYKQSQCLDSVGILWFEIDIEFVVSAQLYVMAGIEVETGVAKRYNFSVTLFERSVKTDVIDLEKAHFSFKFYCMGTAGLKVGFEVGLSLALLSSDVASVGVSAEVGVSLGIWGYFYYSYEKEAGEEPETQKAGAMFFELGIYLEVKFKAHLFNIEKLTYNPTLYENLWPLYSVGSQENVFEFEDYEDHQLSFTMQGTNSLVLPDYIFRMKYLDLKDGKYYAGTGSDDETPSKSFDDDTESRFLIEISDSRFSYNPKTNTLSTTVDVKNMDAKENFKVKIRLTYKQGALAFNQEIITREITVEVKNNADYCYIHVALDGPSWLNAMGPGGTLTYTVRHGESFNVRDLPVYNVKDGYKFVKWIWEQNYRDVNEKLWVEGDDFVGLSSVERRTYLRLTAIWEPLPVEHTVRIFKEAAGGAYIYDRTEKITGLARSTFNLYDLADPGYTLRSGGWGELSLKYEGTYDLYLKRADKTIKFRNVDGEGGEISVVLKAGSALVPPVVSSRLGYNFAGWADASSRNAPCVMPETVPFVNGTIYYTALWTPVSDVPYTVKHYVQNANDDGFELYMTEYLTGSYNDAITVEGHISRELTKDGFYWETAVNPGYREKHLVALDGSTVLRVYYKRDIQPLYFNTGYACVGQYRHGQTVDTTVFEDIPRKNGYRFVGWDFDNDGVKDDTFVMPNSPVTLTALWEGVYGTEYKVIHMVQAADSSNYEQAGFSYLYGVTDATPTTEDIYSDQYIVAGQFVANYEKAVLRPIRYNDLTVMYAYYDRVVYQAVVKAYDPESGSLVREISVPMPYGRSIKDKFLPSLSEFDILGYQGSRYASSGYTEMPDHDIEIQVVYVGAESTPFLVNHYVQRADGSYYLYRAFTERARTGTALHDCYWKYVIKELNSKGYYSVNLESIVEAYVERDGSTVFDIYYARDKVKLSGYVKKMDADGNVIETTPFTEWYLYAQLVGLKGYYDHYEYHHMVDRWTGEEYYASSVYMTEDLLVDIYVSPKSGVPYTVTHWIEKVDGTGYEVYQVRNGKGIHSDTVSAQEKQLYLFGFYVDESRYESIILDADGENNVNVYYNRTIYTVTFDNYRRPETSIIHEVRYGAPVPTPPVDTSVPGYDFVRWEGYNADGIVTRNFSYYAVYELSTDTPYKVNHYVMGLDGEYELKVTEDRTGSTNSEITADKHLHPDYSNGGYHLKEKTRAKIAPDGSTVLDIYYERESFRFSYHYYFGGKVVDSIGVMLMLGAPIPDSIYDYGKDYPAYALEGFYLLRDGEYVKIDELPSVMGDENMEIRVVLNAIGPEVTIVHKVMNVDGETYTEVRESFLAIPFAELDLTAHLLGSVREGFTYRIPVNNMVPDALEENVYEIYYDRNTYTVKFYSDYRLESIDVSYLYGASIGDAPVFERPGYIHTGWSGTIPETMPARDLTFTTTWQIRESVAVTIRHMMAALDGDGYVEKRRETVMHTPELMIYGSNYATGVMGGTYQNAERKTVAEDGTTEVCVYYSRNEYTVRFTYGEIAGAGEDEVLRLPYESDLAAPVFAVTGYVLAGWSPALSDTVMAEDITYTAVWVADGVDVTVKHWAEDMDGENEEIATETVTAETDSTLNGAVYAKTLEGFTFANADRNVVVNRDGSTVINVYYTRNSYTLTFTYGEMRGEAVTHTVKYGAPLPEAPTFAVVGYTFAGWDGALAATMPATDLTYTASWTANTDTRFTVEHYYQNADDDGYTKAETEEKQGVTNATLNGADYKLALPEAIFESAENGVIAADGSTVIRLYYKRTAYTLTFTYGEMSGEAETYTLRYGQRVNRNPSFSAEGYVFAGWNGEIPATMPSENVVLVATWRAADGVTYKVEHYLQNVDGDGYALDHTDTRSGVTGTLIDGAALATLVQNGIVLKSADEKAIAADGSTVIKIYYDRVSYTLTFTYGDLMGESVTHTVRYGAALPTAPVFTAEGYTFAGWDGTLAATMPATDLTYTAVWAANSDTEFTVEHYYQNVGDDGYTVEETEVKYGATASTVNGISYKKDAIGFTFADADRGVIIRADGSTVVKVYYTRNSYTLTYTYGEKDGEAVTHTVKYGAALPEAPAFAVVGYTFAGWNGALAATMPATDLTYTASWTANTDTRFTVEHYYQNADDDGYTKAETEEKQGVTNATLNGADYKLALPEAIFERAESGVIAADGSTVIRVYYKRTTYTLTFTYGEQSGEAQEYTLRYGQSVRQNPSFLVAGYVFAGWDRAIPVTMPAESLTLNAVWTAGDGVAYKVEHYLQNVGDDAYTLAHTDARTGVTGTLIDGAALATLVQNGIVLKSADEKAIAADGSTVIKIYYDRVSYTLTFRYGERAGEDVVYTVRYGAALPEAPAFTAVGYTFDGWDGELAATMPATDLTFTAKWTANTDTRFTVEHYYQDASGDGYTKAETEEKQGVTNAALNGADYQLALPEAIFERAENGVIAADGSTVIKVYYKRTTYTLSFTYGEKEGEEVTHTVRYGAALPEAPAFAVMGYTFAGWDGELVATMPGSDLSYAARWTANTDTRFTVEHYYQNADDDDYTKVDTEEKQGETDSAVNGEDHAKALPEAIFEKSESRSILADGSTVIKVYYKRTTYTLTFTYGEQNGEAETHTLRYGQKVSHNPSFKAEGYVFAGWDGTVPATMPSEDLTFRAIWTAGNVTYRVEHYLQNVGDDAYTHSGSDTRNGVTGAMVDGASLATLVGNGIVLKSADKKVLAADGSTVIEIYYDRLTYTLSFAFGEQEGENVTHTVKYGAALPEAPVFTAVGYTFAGWDSELAAEMPARDLTYTARWTANTDTSFTVVHYYQNANDDDYTEHHTDPRQGTTGALLHGSDFRQSFEEAIFEWAEDTTLAPDGSTVIRVYYKRTVYTLTFRYGHVSDEEESYSVRYGAALPEAPVFTTDGYAFYGWLDEEGLYVDELAGEMPAGDLVYTAYWMANEDTPFHVEHYLEEADSFDYDMVAREEYSGRTDTMLDDLFSYTVYDDGAEFEFDRFSTEELWILPDGSAVLKIYYRRVKYPVTFVVVDEYGTPIDGVNPRTEEMKFGQKLTPPEIPVLEGYELVGYDIFDETVPMYDSEHYIIWRCLHTSTDGDHECDRCYESLRCIDEDDDGHCDYNNVPMDPDNHRYVDEGLDHICDICNIYFTALCVDENKNGVCDVCAQETVCAVTERNHRDEDEMSDHLCDDCGVWMSYRCELIDGKHECGICYARFYEMCTDEDGDCWCDVCFDQIPCVDEDGDDVCDVCENQMPCPGHIDEDENAVCDYCRVDIFWCDEYDDMHRDENHDHFCEACGMWLSYDCYDWNDDGRCEECARPAYCMQELGVQHIDGDGDHFCDVCGCWMSYVCVDQDGDWVCDECDEELFCYDHIDEDENAACDICGVETKCRENPFDTFHSDDDWDHTCDWCGVWIFAACLDDDFDGFCDESECGREFVCEHTDGDEDNYCDHCGRIINCPHDSVFQHICEECYEKVTDCEDLDGDLFCDDCYEQVECTHEGMEGEHICLRCYDYLSDCKDEDGDESCDLSEYFPHSIYDRQM